MIEKKKDWKDDFKLQALVVLGVIALLLVMFNSNGGMQKTADEHFNDARNAILGSYNIEEAKRSFEQVLIADPKHELALYNLARIYYIVNDYNKSLDAIAQYKSLYPEKKRIHYVAGLANAYAGNLSQAETEFRAFVASEEATSWPGYLDLAWILFQQGKQEEALTILTQAVGVFGEDNAWLNTSLGGVYVSLGQNEEAIEALTRAEDAYANITLEEWKVNFSFNDPAQLEKEMSLMGDVIAYNLKLARGERVDTTEAELLSIPFADPSPAGFAKGIVVSACGESCPHTTCTPTNVCGVSNVGTYITCLASCSVSAPADPSGSCTVVSPCGTLTGSIGCNGQCNLSSYCGTNPGGDGDPADIGADIIVSPALVQPGDTVVVTWSSTEMATCSITSNRNSDVWSTILGQQTSSPITQETTYSLSCTAFDDSVLTDSATVNLVPDFQEF